MTVKPTIFVTLACAGLLLTAPAEAQTPTTGLISGVIRGLNGASLEGVEVTISRVGEEWERVVAASREGRFVSGFLPPGEYDVFAERFGYVPIRVDGIVLRSSRHLAIDLEMRESPPPVTEVDRVPFGSVGRERSVSSGQSVSRAQLENIPHAGRQLTGVLSRWTLAGPDLRVQGLPGRHTTLDLDGVRHTPVSHPATGPGFLHLMALPSSFLQDLELLPQGADVEWGEAPGGLLRATTIRGTERMELTAYGNALGGPLASSGVLGRDLPARYGPEASGLLRGPIRRDTAQFALGLQARQTARTISPLAASVPAEGESFMETAGLAADRIGTWNVVSGFGRADWRFGPSRTLMLRANLGVMRAGDGTSGTSPVLPPEALAGTDLVVGGSFFTDMGERSALEFRLGFETSGRDYGSAGGVDVTSVPRSWIHEGGIVVGGGSLDEGSFSQSAVRLSPVVHHALDRHQIKAGVSLDIRRYSEEASGSSDGFLFPDHQAFLDRRGLRERAEGPARDVSFRSSKLAAFVQDRWTPVEPLTVTVGVRLDGEVLPWEDVLPNVGWEERTGLDRSAVGTPRARFSPRLGLEWAPAPRWVLRAGAGLYHGEVDPAILAEVLADSGEVRVTRTLGSTGGWPTGGGAQGATSQGSRLSVVAVRFDAPRTRSGEVAVQRALGPNTSIEFGASYRRTDFLPRRRDLNRAPLRFSRDQFGRDIFGEIVRDSDLLTVLPGSDRRFPAYDVVSGLESDGWSRWWGVSASFLHHSGEGLQLEGRYTYSGTRDNHPGFATGWPEMVRGRPASGGGSPAWIEGRSDLDIPHRLAVVASVPILPMPEVRVGLLYSVRSGVPFTPEVRDALDASSPLGWTDSTPITVPPSLAPALSELSGRWACLSELTSGPAERNVCRTEPIHEVNLRLSSSLGAPAGWNVALVLEGLNLLDSGPVLPDPAVFVVDGSADPVLGGGTVELPVHVNPGFGEPLVKLSQGRSVRLGVEVRH